ncbi:MAG: HAMP domain-containing sensor histidine kinase [Eubacteriales bacterium]|nr:HAMP domain-containing sensor histidine kinase [Eubacteriales bacterium]
MMGKSLFFRMLFVYLLIIVMALTLVGGIFFETLKNDFLNSQMDTMIVNAQEINEWATENYYGRMSYDEFGARLMEKADAEGTVIWLISSLGTVYMIADPEEKGEIEETFSSKSTQTFLEETQQGNFARQVSNVDSSFKGAVMSVAIPLTIDGTIVGAIVVHREVNDFNVGINSIFIQVLFPLLISVLFASVLVLILARHIVKPIKEISHASAELARGNLDWRVKPKTRDEIGELAESFNKMADELKLQDGLRNTFIANVSHELRSPLASVQGFIQGMLDRAIEEEDRDKYLEIVLGETKRMNTLISDLLSLAKIESGQFPIEISEFDINELLRRCIIMLEQRIEEKHLMVNIQLGEEKMLVWADEGRISQVITNLIDNAVKFSYDGGELKIWTHSIDNKVYVNIADTGEGIPLEEQPYIFERFYKVDKSHSRNTPGTGIGLSIVKRIITQHGEKIHLQSAEGKGTTFTFTLTKSAFGKTDKTRSK